MQLEAVRERRLKSRPQPQIRISALCVAQGFPACGFGGLSSPPVQDETITRLSSYPFYFCLSPSSNCGHVSRMSEAEFRDRVVVVTGGANGIGESIVRTFHSAGAQVCFCDLDEKKGAILAKELGERVDFRVVDLAREEEIVRWIQGIGENRQRIDVLVNNAGRDPRIALEQTTAADWDALFATNLRSYFLACRQSVRWMRSGASIVNLASITFHQAPPAMSAYVATKGGIIAFTRSLARELGPRGIRVNTVSPGWVMTERQLRQFITPEITEMIKRSQCIPELVQPDEIAEVVLFLASRGSRAITGQELLVDRGWHHS